MDDSLLSFEQVGVRYLSRGGWFAPARPLQALHGVSFALKRGEVLGIVGESGSGKSTLARLAMRLLSPSTGTVRYGGLPLADYQGTASKRLCGEVQMVFQDPNASLNPRMTIAQCIQEPLALHRRGSAAEQRQEVLRLLDAVGLPAALLQRHPHELSGGQKQRVAIARAVALRPKVLIADEAVAALDASVKAQILNLLLDLKAQFDLSIIFISHDLTTVEALCDRVLVLYLGRLMEQAPRAVIASGGLHPYTQALWRSSPTVDVEAEFSDDEPVAGEIPSPLDVPAGCVFHTRCARALPSCATREPPPVEHGPDHRIACLLFEPDEVK